MSTSTTFDHHLAAFFNNDMEEVMKDYLPESELWTPDGNIKGLEALSSFFASAFSIFPKATTTFELKQRIENEDSLYIVWSAESNVASVPLDTDTFGIKDGKILWQSLAALIIPKS